MTTDASTHAETIARARGEAHAAAAIAADVAAPCHTAVVHLRSAWAAIGGLETPRTPDEPWLADNGETPPPLSSRDLSAHVERLFAALDAAQGEVLGAAPQRRARRDVVLGTAGSITAVAAVVGVLWSTAGSTREGPWRATYYDDPSFSTAAEVLREGDVRFEWGEGPGRPGGPRDGFSVRFDTCLRSPGAEVSLQLVSDDGSHLFVDGRSVIDNSGQHRERARGTTIELAPGVHHLRVDFVDIEHRAMVALLASFDGLRPKAIETRRLEAPPEPYDDTDPCHGL